jgi:hypothetical protein
MHYPPFASRLRRRVSLPGVAAMAGTAILAAGSCDPLSANAANNTAAASTAATNPSTGDPDTVQLKDSQLGAIKIAAIGDHEFVYHKDAVGIIGVPLTQANKRQTNNG